MLCLPRLHLLFRLVIVAPAVLNADSEAFCAAYGSDGCSCDAWFTGFSGSCTGYENCAATFPGYCNDAWTECFEQCTSCDPFNPERCNGGVLSYDCVADFDCMASCECYPLE